MTDRSYFEPASIEDAVGLLDSAGDAKCLAGGASLVAMMNAHLVEPSALVSLRRIAKLGRIEAASDGSVRLGAGALHRDVAMAEALMGGHLVVRRAASQIANPVVRNMGTLGGSVSHSDPAADYPVALVAADAEIEIAGKEGARLVPVQEFFIDWYETVLAGAEMVIAALLPAPPPGATGVYHKLAKVEGDMGIAMVAVILAEDAGACSHLSVTIGGCGPTPVRLRDREADLIGGGLDGDAVESLGQALAEATDPVDDVRATADYRRLVVPRMVARAIRTARQELSEDR